MSRISELRIGIVVHDSTFSILKKLTIRLQVLLSSKKRPSGGSIIFSVVFRVLYGSEQDPTQWLSEITIVPVC